MASPFFFWFCWCDVVEMNPSSRFTQISSNLEVCMYMEKAATVTKTAVATWLLRSQLHSTTTNKQTKPSETILNSIPIRQKGPLDPLSIFSQPLRPSR